MDNEKSILDEILSIIDEEMEEINEDDYTDLLDPLCPIEKQKLRESGKVIFLSDYR